MDRPLDIVNALIVRAAMLRGSHGSDPRIAEMLALVDAAQAHVLPLLKRDRPARFIVQGESMWLTGMPLDAGGDGLRLREGRLEEAPRAWRAIHQVIHAGQQGRLRGLPRVQLDLAQLGVKRGVFKKWQHRVEDFVSSRCEKLRDEIRSIEANEHTVTYAWQCPIETRHPSTP